MVVYYLISYNITSLNIHLHSFRYCGRIETTTQKYAKGGRSIELLHHPLAWSVAMATLTLQRTGFA